MNLGKLNVWFNRGWGNIAKAIGLFNFFSLVYLTTQSNNWFIVLAAVMFLLAICFAIYDMIVMYPQELNYVFHKSPPFSKMGKRVENIEKILQKMQKEKEK